MWIGECIYWDVDEVWYGVWFVVNCGVVYWIEMEGVCGFFIFGLCVCGGCVCNGYVIVMKLCLLCKRIVCMVLIC